LTLGTMTPSRIACVMLASCGVSGYLRQDSGATPVVPPATWRAFSPPGGYLHPQHMVVSTVTACYTCSKSAARKLLQVEIPVWPAAGGIDRSEGFRTAPPAPSPGGFGESRSAICAALAARDPFQGSPSARSLQYEYGNSWVMIIARGALRTDARLGLSRIDKTLQINASFRR